MPDPRQAKKGPLRRSHTKSRKGCLQCKQKHVKCTEKHPQCGNCERLDIDCTYPSSKTPSSQSTSPSALVLAAISHIPKQEGPWNQPLAVGDLELLQNYRTHTAPLTLPQADLLHVVTDGYLQLGFSELYVLHSLLALSALELYSRDRSRTDLFARASALQSFALQQAQPHIAKLSLEHSIGVFVFSSFTAAFSLAEVILNPHYPADQRDPIEEIVNCFQLHRGIAVVVGPFWAQLKESWLKPIFEYEDDRDALLPLLERDYPMSVTLRNLAVELGTAERREACVKAVDMLFLYISILRSNSADHPCYRLVLSWPVEVKKVYLDMLVERDSFSLILLAYYAVLMQQRGDSWYLVGWPKLIIEHVDKILGEEWEELLRWPKSMILTEFVAGTAWR